MTLSEGEVLALVRQDMHVQLAEDALREHCDNGAGFELLFEESGRELYARLAHARLRAALRIRREERLARPGPDQ